MNTADVEVRCSACESPANEGGSLLRCSRCREAYYCDQTCQRKHFPEHKSNCKTIHYECKTLPGKGRALIATRDIRKGHRLLEDLSLCRPVLNVDSRGSRCAYCFMLLSSSERSIVTHEYYSHCSQACVHLDNEWEREEKLMESTGLGPKFPSLILLLGRIIKQLLTEHHAGTTAQRQSKTNNTVQIVNALVSNYSLLDSEGVERCRNVVKYSCHPFRELPYNILGLDFLLELVARVDMNSFSVADGEFVSIGLGVFPEAAKMNHTCHPNTIQTFHLQRSKPPKLAVTVCAKTVKCGDELTVSYIDSSAPMERRQKALLSDYKFFCKCSVCKDFMRDALLVGLRCINPRCNGVVCKKVCLVCSTVLTDNQHKTFIENREVAFNGIELLKTQGDEDKEEDVTSIDAMESAFQVIKEYCSEKSWFYHWTGEILLESILHSFDPNISSEDTVRKACYKALKVAKDILPSVQFGSFEGDLRPKILQYKIEKLKIFLRVDVPQALTLLQSLKGEFSLYYPKSDSFIQDIQKLIN